MSAGLLAYPAYQAFDVKWMPEIPKHWKSLRAKYVLREIDDRSTTGTETLLSMRQHRGLVPHNDVSSKRIAPNSLVGYKRAKPNELVLNRMQASNGMFFRTTLEGIVSPDYAVFRPVMDVNTEFLGLLFRSFPLRGLFRTESKGLGTGTSGFLRLYSDRFGGLPIPLPPRPEQDQIVAYLRAQDREIARFIRAKRRLIDVLEEQKQTVIHRAVTRGLDPNARLKPSGIDWLGEVPEHWDVWAIKQVADVRFSGIDKHTDEMEQSIRLCNYTDVYKNDRITSALDFMHATATVAEIAGFSLQLGDVLITKDSETPDDIAVPALVSEPLAGVLCGYHLSLLRPNIDRIHGEFLFWVLKDLQVAQQFHVAATGVTRYGLAKHDVKKAVVPVPPPKEQESVCRYIRDALEPLDTALKHTKQEIGIVREYRDRLIADVVTGQVDVRGWTPPPGAEEDGEALALLAGDETLDEGEESEDGDH